MTSVIESRGLIFELQWKKKPGVVNKEEDVASLGIWDTADSSLDWSTFKSYLSQNLGTPEHISVAYVDSEGDELPIESECEFQEALKFARERSRRGRTIVLKVDKQDSSGQPAVDRTDKKRWPKYKHARGIKLPDKFNHSFNVIQPKVVNLPAKVARPEEESSASKELSTRDLEDFQKHYKVLLDKIERLTVLEDDRQKKFKMEKEELPPPWFKKYMQKVKKEIVTEVTANTRQMLVDLLPGPGRLGDKSGGGGGGGSGGGYLATRVKKRTSDEDSSDAALAGDQRDHKLLRKIEKLHKREKKLEKKLDTKLEKLENKTKRMMEKKSQSKPCAVERERKPRKRSGEGAVGTYLMDAILLDDGHKAETHIRLGRRFTKIWEIMNNGTLPWTDKTELRLAWGTLGLEPEDATVKCPILEPGEKGQIAVNFRAPDFSGTFESYWHFYHMGERFGHWVGCAVVVEDSPPPPVKQPPADVVERFDDVTNSHHLLKVEAGLEPESPQTTNLLSQPNNNNNINERAEELASDSDEDNLSPSSDTDDDFVVVPMPACFLPPSTPAAVGEREEPSCFDQEPGAGTLSSLVEREEPNCFLHDKTPVAGTVPVVESLSAQVEEPTRFLRKEAPVGEEPDCLHKQALVGGSVPAVENLPFRADVERFNRFLEEQKLEKVGLTILLCDGTQGEDTTLSRRQRVLQARKQGGPVRPPGAPLSEANSEVYAVDSQGSCMRGPVRAPRTWPSGAAQPKVYAFDSQGSCVRGPARFPEPQLPEAQSEVYAVDSQGSCVRGPARFPEPQLLEAQSEVYAVDSQGSCVPLATAWPVDRAVKIPLGFDGGQKPGPEAPESVHILPETLVTGAINVASSAYSTARAVLGNLRAKSGEECGPHPSTTSGLERLAEMGFPNVALNVLLLQRFNNDVGKVVAELLARKNK